MGIETRQEPDKGSNQSESKAETVICNKFNSVNRQKECPGRDDHQAAKKSGGTTLIELPVQGRQARSRNVVFEAGRHGCVQLRTDAANANRTRTSLASVSSPANAPDTFLPQKNLNNWHSDRRRMDWQRENNWFAAISYF